MTNELQTFLESLEPGQREELKKALKKAKEEEPEEEEPEEEEPEEDDEKTMAKKLAKSLSVLAALQASPPAEQPGASISAAATRLEGEDTRMAKSLDATGFVKSLVDGTAAHLDEVTQAVVDTGEAVSIGNTALLAIGHTVQAMAKSLSDAIARIEALTKAVGLPAEPRSVTAGAAQRQLGSPPQRSGSATLTKGQVNERLLKAQVAAKERGDALGAQRASNALLQFSASGRVTPEVAAIIEAAKVG